MGFSTLRDLEGDYQSFPDPAPLRACGTQRFRKASQATHERRSQQQNAQCRAAERGDPYRRHPQRPGSVVRRRPIRPRSHAPIPCSHPSARPWEVRPRGASAAPPFDSARIPSQADKASPTGAAASCVIAPPTARRQSAFHRPPRPLGGGTGPLPRPSTSPRSRLLWACNPPAVRADTRSQCASAWERVSPTVLTTDNSGHS